MGATRTRRLPSASATADLWGRPAVGVLLVMITLASLTAAQTAPRESITASYWPSAAVQVVLVCWTPRHRLGRLWVALVVAITVGDLLGGRPVAFSLVHAGVEALAAIIAAGVITDGGRRRPALREVPDFLRLLAAGLVNGAVVSTAGAAGAVIFGLHPNPITVGAVIVTHLTAVVVLVPLTMSLGGRRAGSQLEVVVQTTLVFAASAATFALQGEATVLTFAPVLFLAWAALRFEMLLVVSQLTLLAVVVTIQTLVGAGPFAGLVAEGELSPLGAGALTQTYLATIALLVLPLAIGTQHNAALLDQITADARRFRHNFTESLVAMVFVEPDGAGSDLVITDLNQTATDIFGGERRELVGRGLRQLVGLGAEYDQVLPQLLAGTTDGWRSDCPRAGSPDTRVTMQLSRLTSAGEKPLFGIQMLDVSVEYRIRRDLEIAQQLTRTTLDTAACIILVVGVDGVVLRVNAATSTITGYAEHELLGRPVWVTGVTPYQQAELAALMTSRHHPREAEVHEGDVNTRAGKPLRVVWSTNVVHGDDGAPRYVVMTGVDVTAERASLGLVNHLMEATFTTALVGIDTRGRISVVNSGLAHLLGYDREELVGEPFLRLLKTSELLERTGSDSSAAAFATLVRGLGSEGETRPHDWTWVTKQGEDRLVSMTLSVAQDPLAAESGYLCVARDIHESRASQQMLLTALDKERMALERMRGLDQAKNQFISTVSHELRTPVTSIVGYAEMMRDGTVVDPVPQQLPLLDTIDRNGKRLIAMIDDLLMLGGLDSGTVQSRRDQVDLVDIVAPVVQTVGPLLVGRHLQLEVDPVDEAVPVLGDAAQLERVLTNLVTNAVKFTDDGGRIRLGVRVEDQQAVLVVSDTGIGIPHHEQAELFRRFFRSSTAQSRQIQGTGLGLSIVSEIVTGHGGTIAVESAHLQGTTFTVRLPLAMVALQREPKRGYLPGALLTALTTAPSEAVTMLASTPTPQSTSSPTRHST